MLDWYKKRKIMAFLDEEFSGTKAEKLIKMRDLMDQLISDNKEEVEKEREQQKLAKELEDLLTKLTTDWNKYPYSDKIRTEGRSGFTTFFYNFEDGEKFSINDSAEVVYDNKRHTTRYSVGLLFKVKFVNFANQIQKEAKSRSGYYSGKSGSAGSTGTHGSYSSSSFKGKEPKYKNPFTTKGSSSTYCRHPRWAIYQTLIITVASRAEQLNNLPNNSDDRAMLENEWNAAIGRVKEMRDKYHFD